MTLENITSFKQTSRLHGRDVELMGTFFIWFFSPNIFFSLLHSVERAGVVHRTPSERSAATSLVTTIITFITGAAAHHDMTTYITGRGITLHTLCSGTH